MSSSYQGLNRAERLEQKKGFERVYRRGRRISAKFFVAYVLGKREGPSRVGVVAGRKVGKAVTRNRAKRVLREVFRKNRPTSTVSADVVLIAKPSISGASYAEVERAYVQLVSGAIERAAASPG